MNEADFESEYSIFIEGMQEHNKYLNNLFTPVILTSIVVILVTFNIYYILPLVLIILSELKFSKYYNSTLEMRHNSLVNKHLNIEVDYKNISIYVKYNFFICYVSYGVFLLTSIFISVIFWFQILKIIGVL